MTVQITIIGMGQIGTSIGLALAAHKDQTLRVGHDKELRFANLAKQKGALDRVDLNLPHAVEQAGLIVLALPMDQVRQTLQVVGPCMLEDAVLIDTSPVKQAVLGWAKEFLPERRHYIGMTPVINPAYLELHETGPEAARADLFHNGLAAIVSAPGVPSDAIKLAVDFSHLLGAKHLFVDALEVDSLMAATHILPQLLSAALLDATVDKPGWREARKLAGRAYAQITSLSTQFGNPEGLASEALSNREQIIRLIDTLSASLAALRAELDQQDGQALVKRLAAAHSGREHWWQERLRANWDMDEIDSKAQVPSSREFFARMLGLGRTPKSKTNKDK